MTLVQKNNIKKYSLIFFDSVHSEIMQFFSSYVFYIIVSASIIYSFIGIYGLINTKDILNMVYTNQSTQIVEMGLFLILGMQLSSKETRYQADEFMRTIYRGKFMKSIAKLITVLILCTLWYAVRCTVIVVFGIVMKTNIALVLHCIMYLLLTTFFPIVISGILGMCIGIQIQNPAKYAAALVVWAITSPLLSKLNEIIATILSSDSDLLQYAINVLSLGTHSIHDSALTYGFNMETPRWIHVFVYLLMVCGYYSVLNWAAFQHFQISRIKSITVPMIYTVCVILSIIISYNQNTSLMFNYYTYGMSLSRVYDINYYDDFYRNNGELNLDENGIRTINKDKLPTFSTDISLAPASWNVNLDTSSMKIKVTASLKAIVNKKCEQQSFTLYRNFVISSVKINGDKVNYKQEGNYFIVDIPNDVNIGDYMQLDFDYEGMSSPIAPANSYMICLPANFPWLPTLGISPLSEKTQYMDTVYSMQLVPQLNGSSEVDYKLNFKSGDVVYTNLTQIKNNLYEGKSIKGLSIVAYPTQRATNIGEQTVYYPIYVEDVLDKVVTEANTSNSIRNNILQTLNQPINKNNDTIVIFPQYVMDDDVLPIIDDNIDFFIYNAYSKDSYYVNYDGYEQDQRQKLIDNAMYSIFNGADYFYPATEYDYINILLPFYFEFWYFNNINEEYYYGRQLDIDLDIEEINENEVFSIEYKNSLIDVITRIDKMISDKEDDTLQKFFEEWYAGLKLRDYSNVYEIMDMLNMEEQK